MSPRKLSLPWHLALQSVVQKQSMQSQGKASAIGSWKQIRSKALVESLIRFLSTSSSLTMCFELWSVPTLSIKVADKKHLKGQEVFNWYGWQYPLTGELEHVIVDSDFCYSHTIIGCWGILPNAPPFYFWMHTGKMIESCCWSVYTQWFLTDFWVMEIFYVWQ